MFTKKYTKVKLKDESNDLDKEIFVELLEDSYYGTQQFDITDSLGNSMRMNIDELKEILSVAKDLA